MAIIMDFDPKAMPAFVERIRKRARALDRAVCTNYDALASEILELVNEISPRSQISRVLVRDWLYGDNSLEGLLTRYRSTAVVKYYRQPMVRDKLPISYERIVKICKEMSNTRSNKQVLPELGLLIRDYSLLNGVVYGHSRASNNGSLKSYGSADSAFLLSPNSSDYCILGAALDVGFIKRTGRTEALVEYLGLCGAFFIGTCRVGATLCLVRKPLQFHVADVDRGQLPTPPQARDALHSAEKFKLGLHRADGPAIITANAIEYYFLYDVLMPRKAVVDADKLTADDVLASTNTEERLMLLEIYGLDRFRQEAGERVIHELPADYPVKGLRGAKLLQVSSTDGRSSTLFVDVVNSTPEPDGTFKRYRIGVEPWHYGGEAADNAHAALASTFRVVGRHGWTDELAFKDWRDYDPDQES